MKILWIVMIHFGNFFIQTTGTGVVARHCFSSPQALLSFSVHISAWDIEKLGNIRAFMIGAGYHAVVILFYHLIFCLYKNHVHESP